MLWRKIVCIDGDGFPGKILELISSKVFLNVVIATLLFPIVISTF
jgi:hypothetical protein